MNLVQQIKDAKGLEKIKLLKEFKALSGMEKIKVLKEFKSGGNGETTESDDQLITKLTYAMEEIKDIITNDDATIEDWESIEPQIDLIEANEDKLEDHELYDEVIELLKDIAGDGVSVDSIQDGGDLFSTVEMDSWFKPVNKEEYKKECLMIAEAYLKYHKGDMTEQEYMAVKRIPKLLSRAVMKRIENAVMLKNEYREKDVVIFDSVSGDGTRHKRDREFKTYPAWKRAVKKLNPNAKFTGDKDIDGSFTKGKYDAEWDGEVGYIVALDGVTADALTAFDELSKEITKEAFEKVENDVKKAKEANPELDAVETGTYVSRKVVNAKQLKEWVKGQGLVPVEDPHVTIVYSKKKVDLEPKEDEVIIDKITGSGILGEEKVLVLFVESKKLTARHNRAKRLGATWDYDSYKPHITISVDGKELKGLPDFEIKLGKEIIKPIKGDFSYRKGE